MIRLFEQHKIREYKELDGIWEFLNEETKETYQLPVPGCWEQHPKLLTYRGKGRYQKKIILTKETNLRLVFKGVSHTADVYFDNQLIAHHYNAFTPFEGIVKGAAKGEHTIKVEVDNSFGEKSALHTPNDYYTYGGITRPVAVEELPDIFIEQIHFTPTYVEGVWKAKIAVGIKNIGQTDQEIELTGQLADIKLNKQMSTILAGEEKSILWEQEFQNVSAWSCKQPNLYLLSVQLGKNNIAMDDLVERVAFRTVSVENQKLCINGEEQFLKGVNRHEDYGVIGCAIPLQCMVQDMDLIQDLDANAVRTCHYPNDERFLDLCDERGILVWEENHARGFGLKEMQNPNFEKQCEDCIREMIDAHYNHPSIVIWGILNECASETIEGRRMYEKQYKMIADMDNTRPKTSATCRHFKDQCLDLPDIVSFNMYSGWYQDVSVKERHEQEMEWINSAGGKGKAVIVSEFGAAAIYGYRDRGHCKWSEECQADIIRENLKVYAEDDRLTGIFIWQFSDCKVTEEGGWFQTRARCHNNKGIVDEYRRPKLAYDTVKEMFEKMK